MSFNEIHAIDAQVFELAPLLEVLNLSCNNIVDLNTWLFRGAAVPRLRRLDLSFNDIASLVAPTLDELASFPSRRLRSFKHTPPQTPRLPPWLLTG